MWRQTPHWGRVKSACITKQKCLAACCSQNIFSRYREDKSSKGSTPRRAPDKASFVTTIVTVPILYLRLQLICSIVSPDNGPLNYPPSTEAVQQHTSNFRVIYFEMQKEIKTNLSLGGGGIIRQKWTARNVQSVRRCSCVERNSDFCFIIGLSIIIYRIHRCSTACFIIWI